MESSSWLKCQRSAPISASDTAWHPTATGCACAAKVFREQRLAKWLGFVEKALVANGGTYLVGTAVSYADLSLFQLIDGLRYAFPVASQHALQEVPRVAEFHQRISQRRRLATYLNSDRRVPFNEDGIFRKYPELDAPG